VSNTAEQTGRAASSIIYAMKSTPMALALLVINLAFIGFSIFVLSKVSANAAERNKSQIELISTLIRDCGQKL
jgi:flagellar biogenesis protein FliO